MSITILYRKSPPIGANVPAWLVGLLPTQRDELQRIHHALLFERLHVLRRRTPRNLWIRRAIAWMEALRG